MEAPVIRKKRALSSEGARKVRAQGHADALEFALAIGMGRDYQNNPQAKKDVIDPSLDAHSVKGGEKKWQMFLYNLSRFEADFRAMNGVGELLIECINSFPPTFEEYEANKSEAKAKLRIPMVKLAEKLQDPVRLKVFLNKAFFNAGEVSYLTVKHDDQFHVFHSTDVLEVLANSLEIVNSIARNPSQTSEQKVVLKYQGVTVGEIEMRNDSPIHYREVRFNVIKPKMMKLLFEQIPLKDKLSEKVLVYGVASRKFGRCDKSKFVPQDIPLSKEPEVDTDSIAI